MQNPNLLLEQKYPDNYEIVFINFLEDVVPTYIFMILNDKEKHESHLYIKHILKDDRYFQSDTESESS